MLSDLPFKISNGTYRTIALALVMFEMFMNAPLFILVIAYYICHDPVQDLLKGIEDDYAEVGKFAQGSRMLLSDVITYFPTVHHILADLVPVVTFYLVFCFCRVASATLLVFGAWHRYKLFIYPWLICNCISFVETTVTCVRMILHIQVEMGVALLVFIMPIRIFGGVVMSLYVLKLWNEEDEYYD